jgi:hypothetical protein
MKTNKNILRTNPGGQQGRGRSKSRWIELLEKGARKMGCRNWRMDAQERRGWQYFLRYQSRYVFNHSNDNKISV